jgi:hypothetical protein
MNQYLPCWQPSKLCFVRSGLTTDCRHLSVIRSVLKFENLDAGIEPPTKSDLTLPPAESKGLQFVVLKCVFFDNSGALRGVLIRLILSPHLFESARACVGRLAHNWHTRVG